MMSLLSNRFVKALLLLIVLLAAGWALLDLQAAGKNVQGETPLSTAAANLARFHADLIGRYPRTTHLSAATLSDLPANQVLLFDVREVEEFAVSHLAGAIQIDPDISADQFLDTHGADLAGKTVVLYCSVGERSSKLAQAVGDAAQDVSIVNLEGGIFNWHNELRPVINANGPTDAIHPFSSFWGRLLERQDVVVN